MRGAIADVLGYLLSRFHGRAMPEELQQTNSVIVVLNAAALFWPFL